MKTIDWVAALEDNAWQGAMRLRVRGDSMYPTVHRGDEVLVEPARLEALHPGDWIVLKAPAGLIMHRFLGLTQDGKLLTKGDGHRAPDPPWEPSALLGRAVARCHQGKNIPIRSKTAAERVKTLWHRSMATLWRLLRRGRWLGVLGALLLPAIILAAVTLVSFEAEVQADNSVNITWETASETNMLGFYVQRSTEEEGTYQRISNIIPAVGEVAGAFYDFTDTDTVEGETYYYQLEALETDGSAEFHGPIPVQIPGEAPTEEPTEEPTAEPETPTATPTATATPEPGAPTPIPTLFARFWADATNLDAGQCTTLRWQTDHAARIELNGEGVPGSYSEEQVCPCADQSYTLRVVGHDGTVEESTITLNIRGACTPVPPGSTATPTRTPRPTRTPTPRPTRTRPIPTTTPRLTQTPHDAQTAPTTTPSPTAHIHSPLAMPEIPTSMAAVSVLPSPTPNTAGFVPTRTPAPTGPGNVRDANARSGSAPGWPVIALLGGSGLIGAGGWGIWRAWKESDGA